MTGALKIGAGELCELLSAKVLRGDVNAPKPNHKSILQLIEDLGVYRDLINALGNLKSADIEFALRTLEKKLFKLRSGLKTVAGLIEEEESYARQKIRTKDDLTAVEDLETAIHNFRSRHLDVEISTSLRENQWMDTCEWLMMVFKKAFPSASQAESYRFISEMAPFITDEQSPSESAVKTHILKRR